MTDGAFIKCLTFLPICILLDVNDIALLKIMTTLKSQCLFFNCNDFIYLCSYIYLYVKKVYIQEFYSNVEGCRDCSAKNYRNICIAGNNNNMCNPIV